MSDPKTVCTRFAPSPTGHLHVGSARTALFNWALARQHGGRFILRIEDTDQKRSSDAASMAFLEDLAWLGITWDEGPEFGDCGGNTSGRGPYFQSQRLEIYNTHLDQLIAEGKAYRAFETPEELDAARKHAREQKIDYRYDRASIGLDDATVQRSLDEHRPHVVRLKLPDVEAIVIHDELLGAVTVPVGELDDFVIRKADGYPTYHFAVVVDDALMGVTHVIRGQEHLKNTAKHMLLQDALSFDRPVYTHMSLTMNVDGSKMSKRDKDKTLRGYVKQHGVDRPDVIAAETWDWWQSGKDHQLDLLDAEALAQELGVHLPEINVDDFRRAGYLPGVMVNFLALLGWSPGGDIEHFDCDFLVEHFGLDRMIKSPSKFDREKLLSFSLDALQAMSDDAFVECLREYGARYFRGWMEHLGDKFELFARANKARSKTLRDPFESCAFFLAADNALEYPNTKPVRKALVNGDPNGFHHLEQVRPLLEALSEEQWTVEQLETTVTEYAVTHADEKLGKVAQPLRIAVSGGPVSPAIFETLTILGRASTLARIDHCLTSREALVNG